MGRKVKTISDLARTVEPTYEVPIEVEANPINRVSFGDDDDVLHISRRSTGLTEEEKNEYWYTRDDFRVFSDDHEAETEKEMKKRQRRSKLLNVITFGRHRRALSINDKDEFFSPEVKSKKAVKELNAFLDKYPCQLDLDSQRFANVRLTEEDERRAVIALANKSNAA